MREDGGVRGIRTEMEREPFAERVEQRFLLQLTVGRGDR